MRFQFSFPTLIGSFFILFLLIQGWSAPNADAQIRARSQEPQWYPFVVARGADRIAIQQTPMTQRPYRPMHFYGNAVRRSYFRGNPIPQPRDIAQATTTLILRR